MSVEEFLNIGSEGFPAGPRAVCACAAKSRAVDQKKKHRVGLELGHTTSFKALLSSKKKLQFFLII
jgi:hypothetical protein